MITPTTAPAATADRVEEYEELVLSTVITHRFLRAGNTVHDFLLAGDPGATPVLVVGGRPDSWWAWHARIESLATRHYVIAPMLLLDHSLRASQVVQVLNELGVARLHVVVDEGGSDLADRLHVVEGFRSRIISCVCLGSGPLADLHDPDLTNRAIINRLARSGQTTGVPDADRRAGPHVPEGP